MRLFFLSILLPLLLMLYPSDCHADITDGMVHVFLRRLVSEYPLEIDMNGAYTSQYGTLWFASGTLLVASVQETQIYLFGNGFTINAGQKVTLTRTSTDENTYLLLAGGSNRYAGDLTLIIENGQIKPIMALELEE